MDVAGLIGRVRAEFIRFERIFAQHKCAGAVDSLAVPVDRHAVVGTHTNVLTLRDSQRLFGSGVGCGILRVLVSCGDLRLPTGEGVGIMSVGSLCRVGVSRDSALLNLGEVNYRAVVIHPCDRICDRLVYLTLVTAGAGNIIDLLAPFRVPL